MTLTRPFLLLALPLLTLTVTVFSQDTTYFDYAHIRVSSREEAGYCRTRIVTDSGLQVTDYNLAGDTVTSGLYTTDSPRVRQGLYKWYGTFGFNDRWFIYHSSTFSHDKENGPETWYYRAGRMQITGNNKDGEHEGEWTAYYPSGKLAARAFYSKGKQTSVEFFLEDGTPNKTATVFMRTAQYPGGPSAFLKFQNATLKYPRSAFRHEIQGTVVVRFKVTKEGKLDSIAVVHSVDKRLDEEALRVFRRSPDWEPAIVGGVPYVSYWQQPIVFKMDPL